MRRNRSFTVAAWVVLVATVVMTMAALVTAGVGVAGLTGQRDYTRQVSLIPGTHLLDVTYQPSWEVDAAAEVCPRINLDAPRRDCENVVLRGADGPREDRPYLLPDDDIRAESALLEGRLFLDAEPGWNPLIASLYGMTVLSMLVLALLLSQLWLLLRAVSRGAHGVGLQLGSMEPGGPQLTRMAFGALLLLLAQVFRRGVDLEHDQRLTV